MDTVTKEHKSDGQNPEEEKLIVVTDLGDDEAWQKALAQVEEEIRGQRDSEQKDRDLSAISALSQAGDNIDRILELRDEGAEYLLDKLVETVRNENKGSEEKPIGFVKPEAPNPDSSGPKRNFGFTLPGKED